MNLSTQLTVQKSGYSVRWLVAVIALLMLLSGCYSPVVVVVTATPTARPPATSTPTPNVGQPPTAEPTATAPVDPGTIQRIEFEAGQTSIQLTGRVETNQVDEFFLSAYQGQIMHVTIESAGQAILPEVFSADGVVLKPVDNGLASWSGVLHADQDYFIRAVSVGPAADYTMSVRIDPVPAQPATETPTLTPAPVVTAPVVTVAPPTVPPPTVPPPTVPPATPQPNLEPERVQFGQGSIGAVRQGVLAANSAKSYILNARAGQMMKIYVTSYQGPAILRIVGPAGVMSTHQTEGNPPFYIRSDNVLTSDGDHLITLSSFGVPTNFDIEFIVETPVTQPPPTTVDRISFTPGATSAERAGTLQPNQQNQFLLNASAGQIMHVRLASTNGVPDITVTDPNGTVWPGYAFPFGILEAEAILTLSVNGDYLITIAETSGAATIGYEAKFIVVNPTVDGPSGTPERISFVPGATQSSVGGYMPGGGVKSYLLQASAGQTMNVRATGYAADVRFTVESPSGLIWLSNPLGSEVYIRQVSIPLPETGDYIVRLSTPLAAGPTLFDMSFEVTARATGPAPQPERVTFAPGTTGTTITDWLPGSGIKSYVLGAGAGQTMVVRIESGSVPVVFQVRSPSGIAWSGELWPSEVYIHGLELALPESGDYEIILEAPAEITRADYNISFTIN